VRALERAVRTNPVALAVLVEAERLELPSWYLGAGAVAQTVWNDLHGFEATHGIADYDLVYFDDSDLTASGEKAVEDRIAQALRRLAVRVDVTNEARVHLWYSERFGRPIPPYRSVEEAIGTWPTTASSIGVRYEAGRFVVCAPFGLSDLFEMIVRPNRALVDRTVYESKAERWRAIWPRLSIQPW
jgi:hypothetical protein